MFSTVWNLSREGGLKRDFAVYTLQIICALGRTNRLRNEILEHETDTANKRLQAEVRS